MLRMCYVCAMVDKKERSYAKESTKSKPSGIRFDLEQLEFIQKRESKLNTKQKVVDFLLNKYWWEQKIDAKPNHKGLPPEYDAPKIENPIHDEPPMFQQPIKKIAIRRNPAQWVELRRECETAEDYAKWLEDLENSDLSTRDKNLIKQTI